MHNTLIFNEFLSVVNSRSFVSGGKFCLFYNSSGTSITMGVQADTKKPELAFRQRTTKGRCGKEQHLNDVGEHSSRFCCNASRYSGSATKKFVSEKKNRGNQLAPVKNHQRRIEKQHPDECCSAV